MSERVVARLRVLSRAAGVVVILVGGLGLTGWILDVALLKSLVPGLVTIKANTALAFVLAGAALRLLHVEQAGRRVRRPAVACAAVTALIGLLTLGEYLLGWDLHIDQVLFREPPGSVGTSQPGRMAPTAALNFLLLGLALLLLHAGFAFRRAQWLSFGAGLIALLTLIGYLYGVKAHYGITSYTQMALHTALGFVVLAAGVLFARPERGLMAIVTSERGGGAMARRLLPVVVALPIALGWLRLQGERGGLYRTEFGLALVIASIVGVLVALIWRYAGAVDRATADRERAEETARRSAAMFRDVLESAPDAMVIADGLGRIVIVNAQAERLFGYTREELLGRPVEMLLPERVRDAHVHHRASYHSAPLTRPMGAGLDLLGRRKDGSEFPVEVSLSPHKDDGGLLVTSIVRDITERKRAEVEATRQGRALHEAETRYKSLFERVPVGLYRSTPAGEIVDWNPALIQMLGYPDRQSLLTVNATDLYVDTGQRSRFRALIAEHGSVRGFETQFRRRDGSVISVRLSGGRIQDAEGGALYYEGSIEDVTELKKVEETLQQSEKLAAMGSLLAGVAHEINNPLAVILGHARLLTQTLQGRAAERGTKISAAAERCARIVKNFLALARQHPPEREAVVVGKIVREAVELLAYQLRVSDVEETLDLAPDLPVLWADPHQLQQVFVNLITNAHQALSQAPPPRRLTIAARHDPSRAAVTIDVADTGPGMRPEVRSRIFEPFFTTKPPGQGTGLGLALCRGIIEGHAGTITVESAPGRGTAIRIELPVTPPPEAAAAALPAAAAQPVRQKSILIVDDEPDVAEILADLLAVDGHRVETAPNGARALEKLRGGAYDAILSDLKMPELDGPSLYRTLAHQSHPLIQRFIFVTGDVLGEETRRFLEETGVLCVSKPFDLEQVRRALDAAFRRGDQGGISISSRGRTVLIADDDPEIRRLIGEYLQSNGYEVLEAENGLETVLHVERSRPNMVILDLMMPRLGGLDALKRIRTFDPEIAVVVVTGTSDPELKHQALALGAAAVLPKPIELADLLKAVHHARRGGPAADASETREGKARGGPVSPDAALVGRVLIVDDDAEIRALLEEFLDQHGYATRSAATAESAFWALMHEVPDVVLLDISMPGLSGVEIIPAIRNVSGDVRIIMVSGVSDVELSKRALAYGAFDYVTKPVDTEYLLRSLEVAVMTKQA